MLAIIVYLLNRSNRPDITPREIVLSEDSPHFKAANTRLERLHVNYQVRAALPKPATRRQHRRGHSTSKPQQISRSNFTTVLPGVVDVVSGEYALKSSHDLRNYLTRGDPVKIGPQLFIVDMETKTGAFQKGLSEKHYKQRFTASSVPLGTNNQKGGSGGHPRGLNGPSVQGVSLYTTQWVSDGLHTWTGPAGGVVGYWDPGGEWIDGECPANVNHGYLPVWFGPSGKQIMELNADMALGCDGDYCPYPKITLKHSTRPIIPAVNQPPFCSTHQTLPTVSPVHTMYHHQMHQQQDRDRPDKSEYTNTSPLPTVVLSDTPVGDLFEPLQMEMHLNIEKNYDDTGVTEVTGVTGFTDFTFDTDNAANTQVVSVNSEYQSVPIQIHSSKNSIDNTKLSDAIWQRINIL